MFKRELKERFRALSPQHKFSHKFQPWDQAPRFGGWRRIQIFFAKFLILKMSRSLTCTFIFWFITIFSQESVPPTLFKRATCTTHVCWHLNSNTLIVICHGLLIAVCRRDLRNFVVKLRRSPTLRGRLRHREFSQNIVRYFFSVVSFSHNPPRESQLTFSIVKLRNINNNVNLSVKFYN